MTPTNRQRVTIFINPSVAKQAKAQAIKENLSLTDLVERALVKYLPKETIISISQSKGGGKV